MAGIMVIVLAALLGSHLFGLRLYSFTRSKLESASTARTLLSKLVSEVYCAQNIYVASAYSYPLSPVTNAGAIRQGNALQVWTTPSNFVVYYWNSADQTLRRVVGAQEEILGSSIANSGGNPVFTLENYAGQVLSNETGNLTVGIRLEFRATNYPSTNLMDFFKYETRVSRRAQIQTLQ